MNTTLRNFFVVFLALFLFSNCAKKGSPTGGPKDTIPPLIIKSNPENFTTQFTGDEIRIYFDEYIKLKDLQKNLIISPPLKYQPVITPLSTSKVLKIKILDTLKENTTYSFNFGKSIVDNNEENAFDYFTYIFSTGTYIDSLKLSGSVKDALLLSPEEAVTIGLYEINETFTDSIVYQEKPTYVAVTKDSTYQFQLNYLKEGNYKLLALQESNSDYIFQPRKDKIGYLEQAITIPTDSSYTLSLFKEALPYKIARPSHLSKNKIQFGYEGNADSLTLSPIFSTPEGYASTQFRDRNSDSIYYFFKPEFDLEQTDTLHFLAKNMNQKDTLIVKLRDLYADSLKVSKLSANTLSPKDTVQILGNNPLTAIDVEKITVLDKDSLQIAVSTFLDTKKNIASILFSITDEQEYRVRILPEAISDFFENKFMDTLSYRFNTKAVSDYGTITFSLQNAKEFPLIVQLVDEKFKLIDSNYLTENSPSYFDYLNPGKYYIRLIYDTNQNGRWDTGDYLKKQQPEKVIYYPTFIEVRANWDLPETFILD